MDIMTQVYGLMHSRLGAQQEVLFMMQQVIDMKIIVMVLGMGFFFISAIFILSLRDKAVRNNKSMLRKLMIEVFSYVVIALPNIAFISLQGIVISFISEDHFEYKKAYFTTFLFTVGIMVIIYPYFKRVFLNQSYEENE